MILQDLMRRYAIAVAVFIHFIALPSRGNTVALLIGNNSYQHAGALQNPQNDVRGIARKFNAEGVACDVVTDATKGEIEAALDRLRAASASASVVMIYFAGHGIEIGGENYIVPIEASAQSRSRLIEGTISVGEVLERLGEYGTSTRLLVLDCCRNDPFEGISGGLAEIKESSLPSNTMVVYSGAPGETVPDGSGENSPFAGHVIQNLVPGRSALNIFLSVAESIKGGQKPWMKYDGEMANLGSLITFPLLGKPLSTGEVNLSLLLRIIESRYQATMREYEQRRAANDPNWTRPSQSIADRGRQTVLDIARTYLPAGYFGPSGVESYIDTEIALAAGGIAPGDPHFLEAYCLAAGAIEGTLVNDILERSLGKAAAASWLEEHELEY